MIPKLNYLIHLNKYRELYTDRNKTLTLEPFPLNYLVNDTRSVSFPGIGLFAFDEMNGPYVRFDEDLTDPNLANFLIQHIIDFFSINTCHDSLTKACQTVQYAKEFIIFLYQNNYIDQIDGVWHLAKN